MMSGIRKAKQDDNRLFTQLWLARGDRHNVNSNSSRFLMRKHSAFLDQVTSATRITHFSTFLASGWDQNLVSVHLIWKCNIIHFLRMKPSEFLDRTSDATRITFVFTHCASKYFINVAYVPHISNSNFNRFRIRKRSAFLHQAGGANRFMFFFTLGTSG